MVTVFVEQIVVVLMLAVIDGFAGFPMVIGLLMVQPLASRATTV